ncbi:receptor-binding protein [Hippocampus erectus paramyxovirus 1]|nr:receptor-binding protein [Hippocampus erectus paramyxovirus 1]
MQALEVVRVKLSELRREQRRDHILLSVIVAACAVAVGFTLIILAMVAADLNRKESIAAELNPVHTGVIRVEEHLMTDLIPKSDLVLKTLSTTLPSELRSMAANIVAQVSRSCSASVSAGLSPESIPISHDPSVKLYSANKYWTCPAGFPTLTENPPHDDYEFMLEASLPTAFNPGGCMRIPSFSLGSNIYAYTVNSILAGCDDLGTSNQILALGTIQLTEQREPKLVHIRTNNYRHDSVPGFIRKSCSVTAGVTQAFMLCGSHGDTRSETENFRTPGYPGLTLDILSVDGKKKTWFYTPAEIGSPNTTSAVSASVGSGAIWRGRLVFLVYVGLLEPTPTNALCYAPGCPNPNQTLCNNAFKPNWYGGAAARNALVTFGMPVSPDTKPAISFRLFDYSSSWLGAEGRLLNVDDILYIYTRSTSWHTLPQVGEVLRDDPVTIRWDYVTATTRPGFGGCGGSNRCPKSCVTGVYTDMFPLSHDFGHYAQVELNSDSKREKPSIVYTRRTSLNADISWPVDTSDRPYAYTTTTCLTINATGYCLHLMEQGLTGLSRYHIIPFGTRIPKRCP